jgi:hypothetical protein
VAHPIFILFEGGPTIMAFEFLRRRSLLTHGFVGWWSARRHAYPGDEHGVRIPVYGWVDAEAAQAAETALRMATQSGPAQLSAPEPVALEPAAASPASDDRIATFPVRA